MTQSRPSIELPCFVKQLISFAVAPSASRKSWTKMPPIERQGRAAGSSPRRSSPRRGRERSRKRDRSRDNRDDYPSKRQRSGAQRVHKVGPDGLLVMNRQGIELCKGFQCGKCNEPAIRGRCPQNNNKAHNCAKCLDKDHGADECERAVKEPSSSSSGRGRGGKGKGRGRGRARY